MLVRQIENLLALLEFFADRERPATLADIVHHFGWPRSSAHNIISTLVDSGYLYEPSARGGYYPSSKWTQLGQAFSEAEPVPESLLRIIKDLGKRTGETIWISAPSGLFAVFLAVVESSAAIRYAAKVGNKVPIHVTASGQSLLSQMSEKDRDILLRKTTFGNWGPNAARSIKEVGQQMNDGSERGWFLSSSYHSADLGGVAVPIVLGDRIFSITVAGPLHRFAIKFEDHAREIYEAIDREYGVNQPSLKLKGIKTPIWGSFQLTL